ncbi:MAG: Rho termination factor N-terminal domain-containing protein [Thermoleophilaceae bacterium]
MSVLQRKELEESPLADLHAIASELGIEGFRGMRRDDLIAAIAGGDGDAGGDADSSDDEPKEAPKRRARRSRGGGRSSRSRGDSDDAPAKQAAKRSDADSADRDDDDDDTDVESRELVGGVLDIVGNGTGFLRGDLDADVYVSAAQIRRCELRAGDAISGRLRPARRNERHPSLVRVEQVNGNDAEPPEQRPLFAELTAVHPTDRLPAPEVLASVPLAKGARVALAGAPGAGATRLLREIASSLGGAGDDLVVTVVLVGARPEEVTEWRRDAAVPVTGGSFDEGNDAQVQAAELAVERAKRVAERGGDAVVLIDSLESLPGASARRLFGAARKLEEGGSLTVVAATGMAWEPQRQAGTRIALDAPESDGTPQVSASRSGVMRADLLG